MGDFFTGVMTCCLMSLFLGVLLPGGMVTWLILSESEPYDLSPTQSSDALVRVKQRLAGPPDYLKRELLNQMIPERTDYQSEQKITRYTFRYLDHQKRQNARILVSMGGGFGEEESVTFEDYVPQ